MQHLIVNATRVDWQVRQDGAVADTLVDPLWREVEQEFRGAAIVRRREILRLISKVAFFQPERALALARWAYENPTRETGLPDSALSSLYALDYADVLHELPLILRNVAYNLEHFADAADLLWELAQQDLRPTNQNPDHPIRVLRDLAEYAVGKPLAYNEAVLECAKRWLGRASADAPYSAFEVLTPLLATEGADARPEELTIRFRPHTINVDAVLEIRQEVIDLAFAEARSADVRRAVQAITAIEEGLRYPTGLFGRSVSEDEQERWTPTFIDTISRLGDLAAEPGLDPVITVAVRRALNWHAHYSTTATRGMAERALARIPTSLEHNLALALHDGSGLLREDHEDYGEAERSKQAWLDQVAADATTRWSDKEAVDHLVRRVEADRRAFPVGSGHHDPFVWTLVHARPSIGIEICRRVAEDQDSALLELVSVALGCLAVEEPARAMGCARELVSTGSTPVTIRVASALGRGRGLRDQLIDGELELLRDLLQHDDQAVRRAAVSGARSISKTNRLAAIELVTSVRFSDSVAIADAVFSSFGAYGFLSWDELSPGQASWLIEQLRDCPSIDNYRILEFLSSLSAVEPEVVLQLLIDRVEQGEGGRDTTEYQPLPFKWHKPLQFRSSLDFPDYLRTVRDWIAAGLGSWHRGMMGREIFKALAHQFDDQVIQVLDEGLESDAPAQVQAVAEVLSAAPRGFVWRQVDFVRRAFEAAARHGDEYVRAVRGSLFAAVSTGTRVGTPGQPFPEDVEQRDRATEIAQTLPVGSIERRFYESLAESAERSIKWMADQDSRLRDQRDW